MKSWREILLLLALTPLLCAFDPFRSSNSHVEQGNALLSAGKVKEALEQYQRAARELPDEPGVHYNLGIAHYRLGQLEQARQALLRATGVAEPELRAKAFYNLGNVHLDQKRWKDAVNAYRQGLQLRPHHRASKWNLELALRRLREEEKKQKKDQKKDQRKDQKKDQKDKKQSQDQKQQDQKQQQDQNREQKKQARNRPPDRNQDKQQGKRPQPPAEMDQVLEALDRNDKNLQRRRARLLMGGDLPRPEKDW
jgi:tetratricopeptide (TPR) repeat protein